MVTYHCDFCGEVGPAEDLQQDAFDVNDGIPLICSTCWPVYSEEKRCIFKKMNEEILEIQIKYKEYIRDLCKHSQVDKILM